MLLHSIGVAGLLMHAVATATEVPRPRNAQAAERVAFGLLRLELDLRVDYERRGIVGSAALLVRNATAQPQVTIPLLLNRLMTVSAVTDPAGRLIPFAQDIVLFHDDSSRQVNAISVTLPQPVAPGDSVTVVVRYGGILVGYSETGPAYVKDHVSPEFTIIREDAFAFPMVSLPSYAAYMSAPRGLFDFSASVTVPEGQVVAAGGSLVGKVTRDSLCTWSFRSAMPAPFLNITIAPYREYAGAAARLFYFPSDSAGAIELSRVVDDAVAQLVRWFGDRRDGPPLVIMEIPGGYGSQANASAGIMQTADAFSDRAQRAQVYHELAHLWNPVDLEIPSPRWNEGLSSFLQWRLAAALGDSVDWNAVVARSTRAVQRMCRDGRCERVPMQSFGSARMTDLSYHAGMLMFHALHEVMGAAAFDGAYRTFLERTREQGGSTADLMAAFRAEDPRSERIFSEWITTTRWYARLAAGESVAQMVEGYRGAGG